MTDSKTSATLDAGDADGAPEERPVEGDAEQDDAPATELTGTAVPNPMAAPAVEGGSDLDDQVSMRLSRGRARGGRKRRKGLAKAVIEEVDPDASGAAAETEPGFAARMLVAPPAHAATRDTTVPTWTFDAAEPAVDGDTAEPAGSDVPDRGSDGVTEDATAPAVPIAEPSGGTAPPVTADAPPPRRTTFGPSGKHRTPAAVIVLTVLTAGLYGVIWFGKVNREMGDFDPRMRVSSNRSTWAVVPAWLIGLGASAVGAVELIAAHLTHVTLPVVVASPIAVALLCGLLVVPYLVVVLPFAIVTAAMTLERLRVVEEHVGMTSDVQVQPPRELVRLLIPVAGGLSVMTRGQTRLNDVWDLVAPEDRRGRRRG